MSRKLKIFVLWLFIAVCAAVAGVCKNQDSIKPVKYVFLFIGDGMSIPQRMMADEFQRLSGKGGLSINSMPDSAFTYTRSNNSFITDSAASGTAIACGAKTDNGKIGVSPENKKLESIAKVAKQSGKSVGIITSVTINHATPAAFYAHNSSRGNYYEIALDMLESNFDFFGGGGVEASNDKKSKSYKGDIYELAKESGYKVILRDTSAFNALKNGDKKVMAFGEKGALEYAIDSKSGLRIKDFLAKAIELLESNPQGFFIMTEGGKIDWMCHANDAATVIKETIDFDKAVDVALAFAKKHPSETLIVVTGDHETGGLTLGFAGTGYSSHINLLANQKYSRDKLEQKFRSLKKKNPDLDFEGAKDFISENLGLKFDDNAKDILSLKKSELEELQNSFEKNVVKKDKIGNFILALTKCLDNKSAIAWTSGAHTALPVCTSAYGVQSFLFSGTIDNTDISKILKETVK